ncbi:carbohydrate-binding domain-containing protein [[Bacteroides] pectinophilus]|uniref:Uncharacterized protein n=1 Tax=[Bacteroides] pectinophilus ATCC 43243 TaxID=483218 RepID=B7AUQ1_9FIRM|nr:hypothetical protein BACPEC_02449 [[Bacteroides] pectinophilus ATCC 43243]UWN95881.1 carbohydrate-binding domain-containing protein [[Bacteroides] pectinophilus]
MKQKHGRKSKIAALLAACALTVSAMIAGGTLSVSADAGEAKENVGGIFLISGGTAANGDYSYDENNSLLTILKSTPITIKSVNNQFVNAKIFIKNGVDANITLDTLRIRPTDGAAISMGDSSASVTITIKGGTSNYLNGVNAAGIEKLSENGRLTITCEHADEENHQCDMNCGMLDARCSAGHGAGIGASGCNYGTETGGIYIKGGVILAVGHDGAGIGGSNLADVSDINISGGIIEAWGDNGAAGIGSATNGGIGSINISGGIISAYGSAFRNSSGSHFYGAAIGAAYCSRFDSINISGGTIYANTAYDSNGTGGVAVGAGNNCNSDRTGIIRISDGVVYAVGSGSTDAIGVTDSVADPADIVIDGGSVYPKCGDDCTVHSDKIGMSSLPKDSSGRELILLEIDNSGNESITVNGKAYPSNSTYNTDFDNSTEVKKSYVFMPKTGRNSVTVGNTTTDYIYTENGLVNAEDMKLDFYATDSNKPLVYGTDYKIDGSTLKILSDKGITVKNVDPTQPCSNDIYIESGVSANITFAGINIQRGLNELSAVEIAENSSGNVNIILADNTDNIISTTYNYAALSKNSDSAECGTLTISCQHSGEAGHICGSSCGGLNAASSNYPAAIGGDDNRSASNIVINGGRINAKGSKGAGIGGGYNAKANNITVNGGIINAESVFGAAIGGGQGGSADGIYINGGIVNAVITYFNNNNAYGCAIGSGATGQADNIIINDGIVTAQGGYNSYALGGWSNSENTRNYQINGGMVYLVNDKTKNLKPFSSDAKLKNNNGEYVYLAAISNPNGEEITINGDPQQYRFLSSSDMTFYAYVPKDIAGTASVKVGDKQYSYGLNEGIFEEMGSDLVIRGDNEILEYGLEYTYPAKTGILTVNNCAGSVTIKNADESVPTNNRIYIGSDEAPSTVNVTLNGVNIYAPCDSDSGTYHPAIECNEYVACNLIIDGGSTNKLVAIDSETTISVGRSLTVSCYAGSAEYGHICDETCGTLYVEQEDIAPAIGILDSEPDKFIEFKSGRITVISGDENAIDGYQEGKIILSGGFIYAKSEGASALGNAKYFSLSKGVYTLESNQRYYALATTNNTDGEVHIDSSASVYIRGKNGAYGEQTYGINAISKAPVSCSENADGSYPEVALITIANPQNEDVYFNGKLLPFKTHSDSDTNLYIYADRSAKHTVKVGGSEKTYEYIAAMRAFAAIGSDLVITAADGSALTPGVDYDYYISSVTNPVTQVSADIGTLNVYTNTPVVIKNADGVSSTQDIIVINASYADVTLAGVNISYPSMWTDSSALCIANDNTASITLADGTTNTLISDSMYGCGIAKDGTGTLTITCEKAKNDFSHKCDENCGTLSAKANMYGSAIGSTSGQYNGKTAQKITILGGNITAASKHGAAIGGGIYTGAENITVSGGNINATGGGSSAAIGSGEKNSSSSEAVTAENIKILGGNINAVGGFGAAAIGGGKESSASDITIANANVKAVTDDYSAAIGGGQNANGKNIRIENSTLYAASQSGAAIIGGGVDGTGDKIYIENSVVSLVQKGSCGPDMIGNGVDGVASEIYIDNSSVAMYSTNTFSPDISQNSQIKNSAGEPVYLLTVDNPNGDDVIVDGVMAIAANNIAADPSDTGLHLWLADRDHSLVFTDADGATTQIDYHFNDLFKVFKLCEADIDDGYRYNETAHWYVCKNSDLCTVKFNYQKHLGGNATCTDKAVCEACGYEYGEPLGHNMQYFDYVPETCTTDGNIEYYKCGNCSKLFTDADGKNEITYADTVIAAKGHRYLTSWTFDSDSHWHKCDVCGSVDKIEPHVSSGHATETAAETCTICGYEIAPVLGHIHANNLMPVYAVKPTCTKGGNIGYYVCSCGKMFADSNAATALTEADIVIPAAGHGATEIRNRVEPTETANGYTGDEYCTVCNELVKRGTVIPATASSGTTTTPSEPTSAPSGTTTTPSEPTSAPSGTTTTPSEPTSAPSGTTTTPSEPTSALTGTTTLSEPTSALTGTTTTPSETTSAQSGTTTTPSETSATTTLPPEDAELPFIKDECGRVIVDENDHAADNESGDAEKSENDETNPVTGAAVAGLIALIILAAAVAVVLSRKKK